jgi:hypothetical protein
MRGCCGSLGSPAQTFSEYGADLKLEILDQIAAPLQGMP